MDSCMSQIRFYANADFLAECKHLQKCVPIKRHLFGRVKNFTENLKIFLFLENSLIVVNAANDFLFETSKANDFVYVYQSKSIEVKRHKHVHTLDLIIRNWHLICAF